MTGYFWKTKDLNCFGAFTPSFGSGLYHVADSKLAPGIKLWKHRSYVRTELWRQICQALGSHSESVPNQLGEDRLARFGAYREFDEQS